VLHKVYFGGGSVLDATAEDAWRLLSPAPTGFEDGTRDFLGITQLQFGFKQLQQLGGIEVGAQRRHHQQWCWHHCMAVLMAMVLQQHQQARSAHLVTCWPLLVALQFKGWTWHAYGCNLYRASDALLNWDDTCITLCAPAGNPRPHPQLAGLDLRGFQAAAPQQWAAAGAAVWAT
jgi:hypothetical protein